MPIFSPPRTIKPIVCSTIGISGKSALWLLVYRLENDVLVLTLARTGTHSDLFGKKR